MSIVFVGFSKAMYTNDLRYHGLFKDLLRLGVGTAEKQGTSCGAANVLVLVPRVL